MPLNLKSTGGGSVSLTPASTSVAVNITVPATAGTLATAESLATSSGASLVGYLPAGTGAVATTVQSKLRESVSVKDFGAVGDGVTDDTAAIQAAITYCRSLPSVLFGNSTTSPYTNTASTLVFPPGKYRVTSSLWFGINTAVTYDTSKIVQNVIGYGAIIIGQTTGRPVIDMSGAFGMRVSGLTIQTDTGAVNSPPANAPNVGILLARTGILTNNPSAGAHYFKDVYVHGHYSVGCVYNYASEINYWNDCYFMNLSGQNTVMLTNRNENASSLSLVTSQNATLDHSVQSAYSDFFTNCLFKQATTSTAASASLVRVESNDFGPHFNNCYFDTSGAVAMPHIYLVNAHGLTSANSTASNEGVSILNSVFEYQGFDQKIVYVENDHLVWGLTIQGCSMNGTATTNHVYLGGATAKINGVSAQKFCGDINASPLQLTGTGEFINEALVFSPIRVGYGNTWHLIESSMTKDGTFRTFSLATIGVPKTAKFIQIRTLAKTTAAADGNYLAIRGYNQTAGNEGQWHLNNPAVSNIQNGVDGIVPVVQNGGVATIEYSCPANFNLARLRIVGYFI